MLLALVVVVIGMWRCGDTCVVVGLVMHVVGTIIIIARGDVTSVDVGCVVCSVCRCYCINNLPIAPNTCNVQL